MRSNFFPPMQNPKKPNNAEEHALYLTNALSGESENANALLMFQNAPPSDSLLLAGEQSFPNVIQSSNFFLYRTLISSHIQNSPHRFLPASPGFPLLVFGLDAEEVDDAPEAAAVMAANLCLARSSPDSAALTYHLLDSKGSRRQPMPISVK